MHITLQKNDLSHALDIVDKAIAKSNTLPILQGVFLSAGETIELSATDMQVYAKAAVSGTVTETGSALVDGKMLLRAVKKLSGTISLRAKDNKLEIQAGRSRFSLGKLDEEFPSIVTELELIHEIDADDLQRVIKRTTYATQDDPARAYLGGVLFGEYAVSTDSNRLAITPLGLDGEYILPANNLAILTKLSGKVGIYKAEKSLVFCDESNQISLRVIDSSYPNWQSLMPSDSPIRVTVMRKDFLSVIDRANIVSGDYNAVKLSVGDSMLTVSIQEGLHAFEESLEVEHEGEGNVHLSAKFLSDYLKAAESEQVTLGLNADFRACLLVAGDYKYILMPVRVV